MSRWFVGAAQQQLRQLDAHAPAAGELRRGAVEVGAQEAEAQKRLLHLCLAVVAARHGDGLRHRRHAVDQFVIGVRLVVGALGQLGGHGVEGGLHAVDMGERLAHLLLDREGILQHHLLRQIAHAHILRHRHGARRGLLQAGYNLEHGALARAVLAHKGNLVAGVYHIAYVVEKRYGGKLHRQVIDGNHTLLVKFACKVTDFFGENRPRVIPAAQAPGGGKPP